MGSNTLEPKIQDRKKFDLDLKYGLVKEKIVADMLQDKKIEVKSERGMWLKTGNIAIEYESYGKPSGINEEERCKDRVWQLVCPSSLQPGRM